MNKIYPSIFDLKTDKLSDILIPLRENLKLVCLVEGCSNYSIELNRTNPQTRVTENITDRMYMLPYAFKEPVSKEFSAISMDLNAATEKDYTAWKQMIDDRFLPLAKFAIIEDKMRAIDNDPDTGCIVHITSGYIVPFTYSKIKDMQIMSTPVNYANIMEDMMKIEMASDIAVQASGVTKDQMQEYVFGCMAYRLHYHFEYLDDDPWNPNNEVMIPGTVSSRGLLLREQVEPISTDIIDAFKRHQKIIITI